MSVLFVHSNAAGVKCCTRVLSGANFKVSSDVVLTSEQCSQYLNSKCYDIVVSEYPIPNWQGTQALELLRKLETRIPLIFVTNQMGLESMAGLISNGAADCIEMDHVGHLPVAVRRALSENNLREDRDRAEKKLRHSEAHYRALVGNSNYGMCRCDGEGKFQDVNQALVTMLAYSSKEELLAESLAFDIFRDTELRAQLLGHADHGRPGGPVEVNWKRKGGTALKVRLSGREVCSSDGEDGYEVIVEDVTKQRELEDHLRRQAANDPLTGLANYRHLIDVLDTEIKRSERTKREFALLLFDLDGLKQVNDRYGHLIGSKALCRLADSMSLGCRNIDTAARFGGDEFALVLPETDRESANLVANRIRETLANDGGSPKLSVSTGVAIYPQDGVKLDFLLAAADVALYEMKATRTKPT